MTESVVNFRLNSGDATQRLASMASASERVRSHFSDLPRNVKHSADHLFRFAQIQERVGRLNRDQQRAAQFHLENVRRHHTHVRQEVTRLQQITANHERRAEYDRLRIHGGLKGALRRDPALAGLHGAMQNLSSYGNQNAGLAALMDFQRTHMNPVGGGGPGWWMQRAAFGANPDGSPRTAGEAVAAGGLAVGRKVARTASMVGGALTAFSVAGTIHRGMQEFEARMELGQEIGAQLSNSFEAVIPALEKMQRRFALTRAEVVPGLREMVRLTGSLNDEDGGLSEQALRLARARGLDPSAVMSTFANNRLYSSSNDLGIVGRLINYSAPNMPQGMLELFSTALQGMGTPGLSADPVAAARWAALMPRAFGPMFAGPRGNSMLQQLMGGIGRTGGSPVVDTMRLMAAQAVGPRKIGGMLFDPGTVRGARAIQESRDPAYLEALYQQALNMGGRSDLAREAFQEFTGLGTVASDRLFRDMQKHGGKLPSGRAIQRAPDVNEQLRGVQGTEAYRWQQTAAGLELDVFAKVGDALKPVAENFREVALQFGLDIQKAGGIIEMAKAVTDAYSNLGNRGTGTALVRDIMLGSSVGWKTAAGARVVEWFGNEISEKWDRARAGWQTIQGWWGSPGSPGDTPK